MPHLLAKIRHDFGCVFSVFQKFTPWAEAGCPPNETVNTPLISPTLSSALATGQWLANGFIGYNSAQILWDVYVIVDPHAQVRFNSDLIAGGRRAPEWHVCIHVVSVAQMPCRCSVMTCTLSASERAHCVGCERRHERGGNKISAYAASAQLHQRSLVISLLRPTKFVLSAPRR